MQKYAKAIIDVAIEIIKDSIDFDEAFCINTYINELETLKKRI